MEADQVRETASRDAAVTSDWSLQAERYRQLASIATDASLANSYRALAHSYELLEHLECLGEQVLRCGRRADSTT